MKITRNRIAARRILALKTTCWVLLPTSVVGVMSFFWDITKVIEIPTWAYFLILISQPIIAGAIIIYRIHKNHDGEILHRWQEKDKQRFAKKKANYYGAVAQLNESYTIKSVTSCKKGPFVFEIAFLEELIAKAMPVIFLEGIQLPIETKNGKTIFCYAEKVINANKKNLVFHLGSSRYPIHNPYYIAGNIPQKGIMWQCEGRHKEKKVFVDAKFFPSADTSTLYPFDILTDNRKIGEYMGLYYPAKGLIEVPIEEIKKMDCRGRRVFLKPAFVGGQKILMPSPTVLSINGKLNREIAF